MTPKEKAKELLKKFDELFPREGNTTGQTPIDCALIAVDRNIKIFTDLVNSMDDFSNESRQVIWQLIENEEEVRLEIEIL